MFNINFRNLWLIFQREYKTRVLSRAFILGTLLTPIGIGILIFIQIKLVGYEDDTAKRIVVIDEGNVLKKALKDEKSVYYTFSNENLDSLKAKTERGQYDGVLLIPTVKEIKNKNQTIYFYADEQLSLSISSAIEDQVADGIRAFKMDTLGFQQAQLDIMKTKVQIDPEPLTKNGKNESSLTTAIAAGIGGVMGFVMYLSVFIYGMMVMRSVMEEKVNRIVEVMIATVKPFELMLGKIFGVGAVGLTQVIVWAILITGVSMLIPLLTGMQAPPPTMTTGMPPELANLDPAETADKAQQILTELGNQNWWVIFPLFLVFFFLGYILYSSLFAAVGSAIGDDLGEGQSLTLPITLPVVLAIYIMMTAVRAPDSSLAVWSSIFPLFSPIVMPARLPFHPPVWQIALSLVSLLLTVWFFVWVSARIYRVGILMYGKKVSFKTLGKWLFYKE